MPTQVSKAWEGTGHDQGAITVVHWHDPGSLGKQHQPAVLYRLTWPLPVLQLGMAGPLAAEGHVCIPLEERTL